MTDEHWSKALDDEAREISEELLPLAREAFEAGEREILMHPEVQAAFAEEEMRHAIETFERGLNA